MSNVINIDNASVDVKVFAAYEKKAMEELSAAEDAKEQSKEFLKDFKETCESLSLTTKLDKKKLEKYFKSRWEDMQPKEEDEKEVDTEAVISLGNLYEILNSALED